MERPQEQGCGTCKRFLIFVLGGGGCQPSQVFLPLSCLQIFSHKYNYPALYSVTQYLIVSFLLQCVPVPRGKQFPSSPSLFLPSFSLSFIFTYCIMLSFLALSLFLSFSLFFFSLSFLSSVLQTQLSFHHILFLSHSECPFPNVMKF